MTGLNTDWAVAELDKFIEQTKMHDGSGNGFFTTSDYTAPPEAEVAEQAQIVAKVVARVTPNGRDELTGKMAHNRWAKHREAAIRARAELVRAEEIKQNLGDDAPEISAANLHPGIWSGARSLWKSGHYVQSVRDAVTKLNAKTQNKVGRRDVSETNLFKQSFSRDEAKPGKSRLRRMSPEDSYTYRSLQRGAMAFAEGVFAAIRNPLAHEADQELSEQVALEYLASLSVLARGVDESTVEHAGGAS